jgi:hypothetical protein
MISPSRRGPATADLLIRGIVSAPLHRNRRRRNTPAIAAGAQHLGEHFGSVAGHAEVSIGPPSGRFSTARTTAEQDLLPLPAVIALAPSALARRLRPYLLSLGRAGRWNSTGW